MHKKFAAVGALIGVVGMTLGMASVARADDFTSDAPATVTQSTTVKVWVVAVPNEVSGDVDHGGCNVGGAQGGSESPHVVAAIASSDTSVATVAPASMTFSGCGETNSQNLTITLIPDLCLTKTATITTAEESRGPGNSVKGVFNTETINVSVAPSNPADPSCTGGGGGGTKMCAEPAAPAWAAALLKASTGLKAKQSKDSANSISLVAQHMTNGAVFNGYAKSDPGYPGAVHDWMVNTLGLSSLASVSDARVIRPGWDCTALS